MKISIRGVRGSIPVSGSDYEQHGGNTTCVVVTESDWMLILDGGSGLQQFNLLENTPIKRVDILLTHLHLDHIQGLGFFNPFFDTDMEVHIWGPKSNTGTLQSRLSRYFSPPLFPVSFRDLQCKLIMHEVENSGFEIGPFKIDSRYVIHPGPTVGYRVSGKNSVFTFIPDHEPFLGSLEFQTDKKWLSGYDLAFNSDLLLHDAQYTATDYIKKPGWGHSSMDDATRFAEIAGVKHLLLAHHDPKHTDNKLNELFTELESRFNYSFKYELAAEGMNIELP